MTPLRPLTLLYAVWCVVVLATFAFANAGGYSAFAAGVGEGEGGQHHDAPHGVEQGEGAKRRHLSIPLLRRLARKLE